VHQKVEVDRFYYYADTLGLIVWQDAVQHFGSNPSVELFEQDMALMVEQLYNHPSVIQWEIFNEGDCVNSFDVVTVVQQLRALDASRLVDTNSGGPANGVASDVLDDHDYPNPRAISPTDFQFAGIGEYGGIGWFPPQQYWPGRCYSYETVSTVQNFVDTWISYIQSVDRGNTSAIVYTQLSDLESECDGVFAYSRNAKLDDTQALAVAQVNDKFIHDPLP
jgi:hypothetical protein